MKRDEKLFKEIGDQDFDLFQKFYFIFDFACSLSELEKHEIVYSKQFFTRYYSIDAETLSKWVKIFCPDLAHTYKKKRIFNKKEVEYLFENLGSLPYEHQSLVDRKEAMNAIYGGYSWKKSRQYKEFSLELSDRFPHVRLKLNKLPPKLMFSILKDELEELAKVRILDRDISYEKQLNAVYLFADMYKKMSPHDWEVRRRWFQRFMNKSDSTEIE